MAKAEPISINKSVLVLGEGKEELMFFNVLIKHSGIDGIQVLEYGGKRKLDSFLDVLRNSPDFSKVKALGITRDADENHYGAFQSVQGSIEKAGLPMPSEVGLLAEAPFKNRSISIGVHVLPGAGRIGMLETLCLESVENDLAIPCLNAYFECLTESHLTAPTNMNKARTHAFLASREECDLRLGEAAEKALKAIETGKKNIYWRLDHPCFGSLRQFLHNLASRG